MADTAADTAADAVRDGRSTRWDPHRRERRTAIIRAAISAISEHGPDALTGQIADMAGVPRTHVYRHFEGKQALDLAARTVFERVNYTSTVATLVLHEAGEQLFVSDYNADGSSLAGVRRGLTEGVIGDVILRGEPVLPVDAIVHDERRAVGELDLHG